ncbi:MAG: hypothetical protein QNJ16_06665 [Rhodobacter sp.]|nr:hypothetical protein [Rhodobacter sp.]
MNLPFSPSDPADHRIAVPDDLIRAALSGRGCGLGAILAREVAARDYVILPLGAYCDGYAAFRAACTRVAESLGPLMRQNAEGDRVIEV